MCAEVVFCASPETALKHQNGKLRSVGWMEEIIMGISRITHPPVHYTVFTGMIVFVVGLSGSSSSDAAANIITCD